MYMPLLHPRCVTNEQAIRQLPTSTLAFYLAILSPPTFTQFTLLWRAYIYNESMVLYSRYIFIYVTRKESYGRSQLINFA